MKLKGTKMQTAGNMRNIECLKRNNKGQTMQIEGHMHMSYFWKVAINKNIYCIIKPCINKRAKNNPAKGTPQGPKN